MCVCVGVNSEGKEVFLKDVWPSKEEVQNVEEHMVIASIFTELRSRMQVINGAVVLRFFPSLRIVSC